MRIYGSANTNLRLTQKAMDIYSNSDPLVITEHEANGEFLYNVCGIIERSDLTLAQLNDALESLGDVGDTRIKSGYTPDHERFDLILRDNHLYIVTASGAEPFNDEFYEDPNDSGIRSVIDGLISDGYNLTTNY